MGLLLTRIDPPMTLAFSFLFPLLSLSEGLSGLDLGIMTGFLADPVFNQSLMQVLAFFLYPAPLTFVCRFGSFFHPFLLDFFPKLLLSR